MKRFKTLLLVAGAAALWCTTASADMPGAHPGYLHALSDLRTAHWLLTHQPGDQHVYDGEAVALDETGKAIFEIKHAAIDDGKDLNYHPNVDVSGHGSRLKRSIDALRAARDDIMGEEDNPEVREMRQHALGHIEHALHAAAAAHQAWVNEHGGGHGDYDHGHGY